MIIVVKMVRAVFILLDGVPSQPIIYGLSPVSSTIIEIGATPVSMVVSRRYHCEYLSRSAVFYSEKVSMHNRPLFNTRKESSGAKQRSC